ncbi:MAG: threonylcarbamoyl-AMP synthase [Clostridia bacterium]|nr:threonylcarbamoyl-AMP synthase [Clostridia bacterium]
MTKVIKTSPAELKNAGEVIKSGGLVVFPTETVYGLGADGLSSEAVKNIFRAKGRPSDNPLILHVSDMKMAEKIGKITHAAAKIMEKFWPGPVTVIVEKKEIVPEEVTAGLSTVAIRMPAHPVARALIEAAGVPVAAPSANLSGKPSPTAFRHAFEDMNERVDVIIDGGDCDIGIESTVVDTTSALPTVLRPGGVTAQMLEEIFPEVIVEEHKKEGTEGYKPKSPGMKYKHYAPNAQVILYKTTKRLVQDLEKYTSDGKKVGVLKQENSPVRAEIEIEWEDTDDLAKRLFYSLRRFDELGAEVVLCELPEKTGMWQGVYNRLYKSAGFDIRE